MKKIIQSFIYLSIAIVFFVSCEKEEAKDTFVSGTTPVFAASVKDSIGLNFNTENDNAVTFSWSNPNYQFASGVSSHNVSYSLEIDTAGANFNGKNKITVSISQDLTVTYTQKAFNILISDLKVRTGRVAQLEMRVLASIGSKATSIASNKLVFKVLPYAPPPKVPVPTAGTLWVVGNAFASGWSNPLPAPFDMSQKFTKVSDTQYELVVDMLSTGNYKLIQEQGVWGTQYRPLAGDANSGTFERRDADPGFVAPAVAGKYKLVFDFQAGTYTVTKQ
jgi:hypothetical protein